MLQNGAACMYRQKKEIPVSCKHRSVSVGFVCNGLAVVGAQKRTRPGGIECTRNRISQTDFIFLATKILPCWWKSHKSLFVHCIFRSFSAATGVNAVWGEGGGGASYFLHFRSDRKCILSKYICYVSTCISVHTKWDLRIHIGKCFDLGLFVSSEMECECVYLPQIRTSALNIIIFFRGCIILIYNISTMLNCFLLSRLYITHIID